MAVIGHPTALSPRHGKTTGGPRGSFGQAESINFRQVNTGRNVGLNVHNVPTGIRFGSLVVGGNDGAGRALHSVNFRSVRT